MTADAARKKKSQENSARRKQVRRCSAFCWSQVLVSSSPRHAGLVNWGVRVPRKRQDHDGRTKKRACPQLLLPPRVEERENIGSGLVQNRQLGRACAKPAWDLGRETNTNHQVMQCRLLRTAGFKGVLQTLVRFCMYAQYSMDFLGGLTHRKQRVTVCKERECVCVCVCVSEGVRRWGEGLAAEKLTEACQNGGEKKEGGGDWAENRSVPAQSLGWLGDRAAGWMGWDGMGWKMDMEDGIG